MTQVKQGRRTFTSPGSSHQPKAQAAALGPCQATPSPRPQRPPLLSSQGLLLSSTNTLGQNTNGTSFPAAHRSRSTAHPKGVPAVAGGTLHCSRQQPKPAVGTAKTASLLPAHAVVPRELLTPLYLLPKARERPRPRARLWPSPSLQLWQPLPPLGRIPRCSPGHRRPPASCLLRTPLGHPQPCDLLMLSSGASGNCWHCPSHTRDNPRDGRPRQRRPERRLPSSSPAAAPSQPDGAVGRQHSTRPSVKTRDARAGSEFLAGRAALNFPWMPITWLKAEPRSGLHHPAKQGSVSQQQQQLRLGAIR